jgi:hypothetical protein
VTTGDRALRTMTRTAPVVGSSRGHSAATLAVYGGLHAVVDYTSAGIVLTAAAHYSSSSGTVVRLFILYNVLAFGLQVFIGCASDRFGAPRGVALIGGLLVVVAVATLTPLPLAAAGTPATTWVAGPSRST